MTPAACPACHGALDPTEGGLGCPSCGIDFPMVDGIGRFLTPDRAAAFGAFLRDYTTVRHAEGRAHDDPAWYRHLPEPTPGDPMAEQWRMRAISWRALQRHVLAGHDSLVVVDVGAGTGWLSWRLTELGHTAIAVDLTVDPSDGLAAARHFTATFRRDQAEMDALALPDGAVDLVVFNASLHYATDLATTLREARRVLRPGGRIVVMDSPIYRHARDGEAMVREREDDFERRFGTRSDTVRSIGFLTPSACAAAGEAVGLRWARHRVWYGWRWHWRPVRNRLRRRRAPSRFELLVATPYDRY